MSVDEGLDNIEEEESESGSSFKQILIDSLQTLMIGFLLCIFLRGTIAEARYIPSGSMEPTLMVNDRILVQKLTKYFGDKFQRGDIIVFYPPEIESGVSLKDEEVIGRYIPFTPEIPPAFIKRVVAVPGDVVKVVANKGVYVNGKLKKESYISEPARYNLSTLHEIGGINMKGDLIHPYANDPSPIVVPEGHLFVMGDNRNSSSDSHVWGFLKEERVVGKMCAVFWKSSWIGQ